MLSLAGLWLAGSVAVSAQVAPAAPPTPSPDAPRAERVALLAGTTPATSNANDGANATPATNANAPAASPPARPTLARLGVDNTNLLTLSLNEAVRRAIESNNDIEVARTQVGFAESTLRVFEAVYDPVFSVTPQLISNVTPVASALGGSDQSGSVSTTALGVNTNVTRFVRRGGGQVQFFHNNTRESTSSSFSQLTPFYSTALGVQLTQPLARNRAFDLNRRNIRVQRKVLEQSDSDFRRRVTDVIADVQRAYWDLVFALRDQQNRQNNLELTRQLARQTEQRIEAGSVAPIARAEVQTELSNRQNELIVATQEVSVAENRLKQLVLRDPLSADWSAQVVPTDKPHFDEGPVALGDALNEARSNRQELRRLRLQQEINGIEAAYFQNQARPRIDLHATVSTVGLAGSPVEPVSNERLNGGYGQSLANMLSMKTRNVTVGVTIELPFGNKRARAELAGARLQGQQLEASLRAQEQSVIVEVRNAAQAVESSRQRVVVARDARQSAELQLAGERRLYEVGHSTTFLLFQRENQLTGARNAELRAEIDYNKALADLQRATSTSLRAHGIDLAARF